MSNFAKEVDEIMDRIKVITEKYKEEDAALLLFTSNKEEGRVRVQGTVWGSPKQLLATTTAICEQYPQIDSLIVATAAMRSIDKL